MSRDQGRQVLALARAKRYSQTGEGRQMRVDAGLSLGEVARGVGVGTTTVHRWERGRNAPHGNAAARWAELLEALATVSGGSDAA